MKTAPRPARWALLAAAAAAVTLGGLAAPAAAQSSQTPPPPLKPPAPPEWRSGGTPYSQIGFGLLLGFLIVGVNLIPSKRGHQD